MRKGLLLTCILTAFVSSGCGSDPKEGLVTNTVDLLYQTRAKVNAISDAIDTAVKKADKGTLDLKEAVSATEDLKRKGEELQRRAQDIRSLREPTTEKEKDKLREKFSADITKGVKELNESTLALDKKLKALDEFSDRNQAAVEDLRKKIKEAQGVFDTLARRG